MNVATGILREQWAASCTALQRMVGGLSDAEFRWEPCADCWSVRPDPNGGWIMDYPDAEPDPPPVTTIAWRLLHITHGNWIYWEHAFGPARRNFPDLPIFGDAAAAVADLTASQRPVTDTLAAMTDGQLDQRVATQFGDPWPAKKIFTTLLNEQVHHGAEISLLRDLYRNRSTLRTG
jgi:hypothetical protein